MPELLRRRPTLRRMRLILTAAVAGAVGALVVINNQPTSPSGPSATAPVRVAAAASPAVARTTAPSPTPTPAPAPVQAVHGDPVAFADGSADHSGAPAIRTDTGVLVDLDTGTILWAKAPHQPHPAASTVKVLTSLVALENFDPDRQVTITPDALGQAGDETRMGLLAGQRLTVRELLSGMMMVSANDAATAIAVDTVGLPSFVATMNAQLAALGLHDSHVVSPVGLDDPGQVLSAYDLAGVAATVTARFPLFAQTVAQHEIDLPAGDGHPEFDLGNIDHLWKHYPGVIGIKTGWTGDAGYCMVGEAQRGGHRLLVVLLGAPQMIDDTPKMLDWGFIQEGVPTGLPTPSPSPKPAASPAAHR